MSGIIAFGPRDDQLWGVANWAFGRLLTEVRSQRPLDESFSHELTQAEIFQHLDLPEIAGPKRDLADSIRESIATVATMALNGAPGEWQEGLDEQGKQMYLEAMRELLEYADRA